jgi:putative pyrimidine permease RutG
MEKNTVPPRESFFPRWRPTREGLVLPEERLPAGPTLIAGIQHIVAMFGSTVLAPLLMGFDPNVAIFFSGIATLIFFVITRGRVPSYLGSSFSFIGVVIAATAYAGSGANPRMGLALGGILAAGTLDAYLGRAFLSDGLATMLSAAFGGPGVTTYAENIGVMAVTRIYSTLIFPVAAVIAIVIGLSPKIGALVLTIPEPVIGGLSIVVFGLIAATAGRIWAENRVDFADPRNLLTAGVALTLGAGDLALPLGTFSLSGIATATFGAILLYHALRPRA